MAQPMRPISTVTDQGNFTGPSAHGSVDGDAPDTGDYWSGNDNAVNILEALLTDLSGSVPGSGTCTVSVYQVQSDGGVAPASGGKAPNYSIEVYEGGAQRASRAGVTAADGSFALDNILTFSAAVITDWSDVRVRFTSTGSGGSPSGRRGVAVSYIDIVTPDAAAAPDDLLAEDVESASEVSTPSVGQEHVLTADDVESASELTAPAVGQIHVLLAISIESASEVSAPIAASGGSDDLLAEDIESASEVTLPAIAQVHALAADDIESVSELGAPTLSEVHALLADDLQSISELTLPALAHIHVLAAIDAESASELSLVSLGQTHILAANNIQSFSQVGAPMLAGESMGSSGTDMYILQGRRLGRR